MYAIPEPAPVFASSPQVKLTWFDRLWANLVPKPIKPLLPPWQISAAVITFGALYYGDPLFTALIAMLWGSLGFAFLFRRLPKAAKQSWLIPLYHAALFFLVNSSPVVAQSTVNSPPVCTGTGLFAGVTSFVSTLFANVTFGGVGGGQLSSLICQVVGFLTLAILLGFLASLGYVAFQIGYQRQPVSTALEPLFGFLIFAGGSAVVIGVMV